MKIYLVIVKYESPRGKVRREFICDGETEIDAEKKVNLLLSDYVWTDNYSVRVTKIPTPYEIF